MLLPSKPSDSALVPSTENESPLTPVASAPTSNDDVAIAAAGLALLSSSVCLQNAGHCQRDTLNKQC
jgi:hypothetical protein